MTSADAARGTVVSAMPDPEAMNLEDVCTELGRQRPSPSAISIKAHFARRQRGCGPGLTGRLVDSPEPAT
jgi:hypothetical protein